MRWMKIGPACEHAGNLNPKVLYAAVERGDLRVARVGTGRNMIFSDEWLNDWLTRSADVKSRLAAPIALREPGAA